jgi:6-pyruvoyltetrahydropterin/6-carboxytetrahydropterin synthase
MAATATRYHDFCMGHRVVGHENKCKHLHGHNYRVTFHCEAMALDHVGRVVDFSVIKSTLCEWLEENWDHKTVLWDRDPYCDMLPECDLVRVPFNPTAENIAEYLVTSVGPTVLPNGVVLTMCEVQETRKCSATYEIEDFNHG